MNCASEVRNAFLFGKKSLFSQMLTQNKCCPNYGFDGSLQQSCLCQQSEPSGGWLLTTEWGFHQECHHHGVLVRPRPPQSGLCVLTVRVIDVKYKLVLPFFSLFFFKLSSHIKMKHKRAATPTGDITRVSRLVDGMT